MRSDESGIAGEYRRILAITVVCRDDRRVVVVSDRRLFVCSECPKRRVYRQDEYDNEREEFEFLEYGKNLFLVEDVAVSSMSFKAGFDVNLETHPDGLVIKIRRAPDEVRLTLGIVSTYAILITSSRVLSARNP